MAAIKINIKGSSKNKAKKKGSSSDNAKPKPKGLNVKNDAKTSLFADSAPKETKNETENAIPVTSFTLSAEEENLAEAKNEETIDLEYIANIKPALEEGKESDKLQGETEKSISLMKAIGFTDEEILVSFK